MPNEHKITRISNDKPREWPNPHGGIVYYINVLLEGHQKPVSIGKKSPDALKVGDTVYGTIEPTDALSDKFKAAMKPEASVASDNSSSTWQPRDDAAIKAQFSIKAAVELLKNPEGEVSEATIEVWAKRFYLMIDRIKDTKPATNASSSSQSDLESLAALAPDDEISLEDIPPEFR